MKRVIVSDTHIGTKFYKAEALHSFLENIQCDELILAGDIIDFIKIPVFTFNRNFLEFFTFRTVI